jgi:hypothetical protein
MINLAMLPNRMVFKYNVITKIPVNLLTEKIPFPMKFSGIALIIWILITPLALTQEIGWRTGFFTFFDNSEFSKSAVKIPQTMSGVVLSPEVALRWDSVHRISGGLSLLHEFGSTKSIDYLYPTAYFTFNRRPYRFVMGAFPRSDVLDRYPRIFFQDSITYYRPNINGFFWETGKNHNYFNLWLDWTSRKTEDTREAFFVGFSGRYEMNMLFAQHFGYMYHFAGTSDPLDDEALHDNILLLSSIGVNLAQMAGLSVFEISAGWATGLERARADKTGWINQGGLLMEAKIEFKGIGLFNTFYKGEGTQYFYNDHGNDLYWGDPVYRSGTYNRSDIFIRFFRSPASRIDMKLGYSLHFLESRIYHQQVLKVNVDLERYYPTR